MLAELFGIWSVKLAGGIALAWGGGRVLEHIRAHRYVWAVNGVLKNGVIKHHHLITSKKKGNRMELHYTINHGLTQKDIEPITERLKTALGCPVECVLNKGRLIILVYPLGIPTRLNYPGEDYFKERDCHCIWPAGKGYTDWLVLDLAEGPHLLIGGITGKGKSVIINQALYTNIAIHGDTVNRYLIDFKFGIEAEKFKHHVTIASKIPQAVEITTQLVKDMEVRAMVLKKHHVEKWQELAEQVRPNYQLLVIDEFAEVSPDLEVNKEVRKVKDSIMQNLMLLLQKGRAVGISVVICTQRPDREVVPGILKNNIPCTMALQVRNEVNSRILLDNDKAVWLRGKGRCLVQTSEFEKEVQVPYLSGKSIRKRLANIPPFIAPTDSAVNPSPPLQLIKKKLID